MFLRYGSILLASTLSIAQARAAVYTVGADGACTHTTIAAAVAAAEAHPGADTIRIATNQAYASQAIVFTTSQELDLVGGFADCSQSAGSGNTTLDGSGGAQEPVLRIIGNTGALVRLSHLTISGGDEDGTRAGGVDFSGDGILDIRNSVIAHNTGGEGGGIRAAGSGSNAELVIGENVGITFNTARYDGGGIWAGGVEMTMIDPGVLVAFNEATGTVIGSQVVGGRGGGLYLYGGSQNGYGYIGAPSTNGVGPIYANTARRGGGIAVYAGDDGYSTLQLFSTSYTDPTKLRQNFASEGGGALYLYAEDRGGFIVGHAADALLRGVDIVDNTAPHAPIAWVQETGGTFPVGYSAVYLNDDAITMHPAALPCPVGRACSQITGNIVEDGSGAPVVNPLVAVEEDNEFYLGSADVRGNQGSHFIRTRGDQVTIFNSVIAGNALGGNVVSSSGGNVTIESTTIAGNGIGAAQVLDVDGDFRMQRSVLWQPGWTSLSHSGGSSSSENVLTSERGSLDGGNTPYVLEEEPRFVDPERGDYHLRAASPAVDFASTGAGPDLEGRPRAIDLPIKWNRMGSADLGAYERQSLQPLVLNTDFDADLHLWNLTTFGVTTWDATQNRTGAPGSGSARVSATNVVTGSTVGGLVQCVHLPGPGTYALNGWGRGTGTDVTIGDLAQLYWEYRRSGGENCTGGLPNATGSLTLSSSNRWGRPATPAFITVTEQDWTSTSSIAVTLVAQEFGPGTASTNAWFDGVTLSVEGDDRIFANGFEGL